jgi:hypothetical protein
MRSTRRELWPLCCTHCADCGLGTHELGEWYMVNETVWEQAWRGRRKSYHQISGQEVLCIGCLEERLGRKLTCADFMDVPLSDPAQQGISERLRDRLSGFQLSPMMQKIARKYRELEEQDP